MPHTPEFGPVTPRLRERGVGLIELMVALTLGLVLVAGVGYIYLSASGVYRVLEAHAMIQENARYAFERMGRDIRMAGFAGCSTANGTNMLGDSTSWQYLLYSQPLQGFERGTSTFPTSLPANATAGDAVTVLHADNTRQVPVTAYGLATTSFSTASHTFANGQVLVASNCAGSVLLQKDDGAPSSTSLAFRSGTTSQPGNVTLPATPPQPLKSGCDNATAAVCSITLMPLEAVTYFLANNSNGVQCLYRQALRVNTTTGNAELQNEQLIEGVQDMQITYGMDTTATPDGAVDQYVTANDVSTSHVGTTAEANWQRVLSVRIQLLLVSVNRQAVNSQAVPLTFNGVALDTSDGRVRKAFTNTIAIRNRL